MPQKWRPAPIPFSSPSPPFRPCLSFAPNLYRAPLSSSNASPHPFPPRTASHSKPFFQISNVFSRSTCFNCGLESHLARSCLFLVRCFLCGDYRHKQFICPSLKEQKTASSQIQATSDNDLADALSSRSSRLETDYPMDRFLVDPDVMACCKFSDPKGSRPSPVDLDGLQLSPASPDKDLVDEPSNMEPKTCVFHRSLRTSLDKEKWLGLSRVSSTSHKGKRLISIGKGSTFAPKRSVLRLQPSTSPPSVSGFALMWGMHRSEHLFKTLVGTSIVEDCPAVQKDVDRNGPLSFDLPPAPLEVISSLVILDDMVDRYNEKEEEATTFKGMGSRSIGLGEDPLHKDLGSPVLINPVSAKKKKSPPLNLQVIGPPIAVSRSPRFLGK